MSDYVLHAAHRARFAAGRYTKSDLFRSDRLMLGLNCFEAGQSQAAHGHADADKFYLILSGKARMRVGAAAVEVTAGDVVWCPAGLPHGVDTAHEPTVMVIGMAPAP